MFNPAEKFKFKKACFELFGAYDEEVLETYLSWKTVEITPKEVIFHHLKKRVPCQTRDDLKSCQYFKKLTLYEKGKILDLFDDTRKGNYVEPQRIVAKEDIFNCGLPLRLVTQEEKKALFKETHSLINSGRIIVAFVSLLYFVFIAYIAIGFFITKQISGETQAVGELCLMFFVGAMAALIINGTMHSRFKRILKFLDETDLYTVPCYAYSAGRLFWYRLGGNRTVIEQETRNLIRPMTYGILIDQFVPITGSWSFDKEEKQNLLIFKYDNEVFITTTGYLRLSFDFFK